MKKIIKTSSYLVFIFTIVGCLNSYGLMSPQIDNNITPKKIGVSSASTIFFVANLGDASLQSAIEDGKIKKFIMLKKKIPIFFSV